MHESASASRGDHPPGTPGGEVVPRCGRRGLLLGALVALPVLGLGREAAAANKLVKVERSSIGTTLHFHLDWAPYPKSADKYRDPTVVVFVPAYFRLPRTLFADVVMHFHGHRGTALRAIGGHQLREQLFESKQNAILVVPQGPVMAVDSSFGNLQKPRGLRKMLSELTLEMRRAPVGEALGKTSLAGVRGVGVLCLSAHSGGYQAVASCIRHGGLNVNEVYLFDSLYGEVEAFAKWVLDRKGKSGRDRHKLVSYYAGGEVEENSLALLQQLKSRGVRCYHETRGSKLTRAQLTGGNAIFIATPLGHSRTAYKNNGLRDCLYASCLKRHVASDWFENKNKEREIEQRPG